MSWTRLTLQVRTPLFGGDDAVTDTDAPIRVPSIRGALRFWFRALASGHGVTALSQLWEDESAVFGSTDTPSPISLRVAAQELSLCRRGDEPDWANSERRAQQRGFDGAQYLLGQGLWKYNQGLQRDCVEPGGQFALDIRFGGDEQIQARFMLALWAWLIYGGLGARTRRGFGQLVCTAVEGRLPGGWTHDHLVPPRDADGWQALGRCAVPEWVPGRAALGWGALIPENDPTDGLPEIPALTPRWWAGFLLDDETDSLGTVLHVAGLRWRRFRAADGSDYLDLQDKPDQSTRSPEWVNVIRRQDRRYPIAALGLPVGYFSHSQEGNFSATVTPYVGDQQLRRASPIWLRPVLLGDNVWGVFTHVFFARLLPPDAELRVSGDVRRFARNADACLEELRARLTGGDYQPARLTRVSIMREDGQERALHIPPVPDRIVERAVLSVLNPLLDPLLGPSSFAYRPGLGVLDAVQELARLRDEGFTHVLRTDIADCFPTIRVENLRRVLGVIVPDPELIEIVDLLLTRPLHGPGHRRNRPGIGLPQGSPLSPIFANLVLEHVDDRLRRAGYPVVRYSDDLAILATSRDDALEAGRVASSAAEEIGMTLGEDKTEVMSFETGFCFLGEDFGTRYPPVIEHRIDVPDERTLFVSAAGSRVRLDEGRVVVERDEQQLLDVPAGLVARVVCFGPVGVTAGLRNWALSSGVELVFCSQRGRYLGQIIGGHTNRVERLRHQLTASEDPDRYLPVAREIVAAKIRKQAVLLRRVMRKETAQELAESVGMMEGYAGMLPEVTSREEVMGLEGAAARAYFQAWAACVDPSFGFTGRNRRPPLEVVNSGLSFGYAILLSDAVSALVATGLDPAIGFLHTDHDGRPSLALDLVEEFRPLVVDQIVMEALRRRRLRPEHGRHDEHRGGVLLTAAGREIVLDAYERRMLQMTRGALPVFAGTLRWHLYRQAQVLTAWVENLAPGYHPVHRGRVPNHLTPKGV